MKPPLFHRFLGFAGIYALLECQERRLATQEQAMSKIAPLLALLAASVPALTDSQKREADDIAKISTGISELVASKADGDPITADELTQLQGFATVIQTAADSSKARADELDAMVAQLPSEPSGEGKGDDGSDLTVPTSSDTSATTTDTTVPSADPTPPLTDGASEVLGSATPQPSGGSEE